MRQKVQILSAVTLLVLQDHCRDRNCLLSFWHLGRDDCFFPDKCAMSQNCLLKGQQMLLEPKA